MLKKLNILFLIVICYIGAVWLVGKANEIVYNYGKYQQYYEQNHNK